jgi:hypothetical protein
VTGVRTDRGDLAADLVVDATGRRSPIDDWLTQIGARTTATWRAECGIAYFSRHYRVRPDAGLPAPLATRIVVALDEFLAGKWGGDNGAVQLVVAPLAADHRFRTARDPRVFTAVLRTIPTYAAWLDVMDPITSVFPMAGLHNTLRRLVADGTPVATGLHAIGDSVCTTNPTLGRGLALALAGIALGWVMYGRVPVPETAPRGSPLVVAARNELYGNTINESLVMRPGQWLTRLSVYFDNRGVDGLVNSLAALVGGTSGRWRRLQTGFVRSYALSMFFGAVIVVALLLAVRL